MIFSITALNDEMYIYKRQKLTNGLIVPLHKWVHIWVKQKLYAEALDVMDDEHDTLLANCMDVHRIK